MNTESAENHALITQGFLYNIAGSETVAFEVAQYFSGRGWRVTVVTHGFNPLWASEFDNLQRTRIFFADDARLVEHLAAHPPTLAWLHHQVVPESVLRTPPPMVIFNQMSATHPLEYPFSTSVVRSIGTLLTFNAEEILDIQRETGILDGIEPERLAIFGNPAPDDYFVESPRKRTLGRILVVSNHLADELVDAVEILRTQHGLDVDVLGLESTKAARAERLTPQVLNAADAVITIGKTVQYSIASGVPVYCYDHFGGPGWLSRRNLEQARRHNFSGRSFTQKTAEEIVSEIVQGFTSAAVESRELHLQYGSEITMSKRMPRLLSASLDLQRPSYDLTEFQIQGHLRMQSSIGNYARIAAATEERAIRAEAETVLAQNHSRNIEASPSFKLAQKISRASHRLSEAKRRIKRVARGNR